MYRAMLHAFGPDIWIADGPAVTAALGFHYPTRMAVMRLTGGDLFIWSPIHLTEDLRTQIAALGRVGHIIAPNGLHHLSIPEWQRAYPDAKTYAAPGLAQKRKDITFDGVLGEGSPVWAGEIDQVILRGRITTEAVFFHRKSATVLFTDVIQQFPPTWFSSWRAIVAKLDLMVTRTPTVPRKFRLAFTDRRALRAAVAVILSWPVEKVLMAHGTPVVADGQQTLRGAFGWLTG
jgi:Domain of unknown function (DUF4336)